VREGRITDMKNKGSKLNAYRVKTTDFYGEWESAVDAKGKKLKVKNDMPVYVTWPNKKTTPEILTIKTGTGSAQVDMNNYPDSFPTRHLVVKHSVNGVKLWIPLTGLKISVPKEAR
jgi:hypothetical protein